jgi:hypothetical protein
MESAAQAKFGTFSWLSTPCEQPARGPPVHTGVVAETSSASPDRYRLAAVGDAERPPPSGPETIPT